MKKEILTIAFIGLIATTASTTLNAGCLDDYVSGSINQAQYDNCGERENRNAMSYEERTVYDLEKENELNRRQKAAEAERDRLNTDNSKTEYEDKSAWEKTKSWFN